MWLIKQIIIIIIIIIYVCPPCLGSPRTKKWYGTKNWAYIV
jgi:hypothetical protein